MARTGTEAGIILGTAAYSDIWLMESR
jgi:hypothetical protein